ncbi:MAG: hypothetical protein ACRDIU_03685 [Actinomycetota bacterium]
MAETALLIKQAQAETRPDLSPGPETLAPPKLSPPPQDEVEAEDMDFDPVGEVLNVEERLVLAPCNGRFRSSFGEYTVRGQYVTKGQVVGTVISTSGEKRPVCSPFSGWVMGHLIPEGSPVSASTPVAWLRCQ